MDENDSWNLCYNIDFFESLQDLCQVASFRNNHEEQENDLIYLYILDTGECCQCLNSS